MPALTTARDLVRDLPFQLRDDGQEAGDGRTLSGYAAVFGESTEIDSWEGTFTESIRKGAFRKTIRETTPVMQFDHGRHPLIGSLPIGQITDLREDDHGLLIEGRISDNWLMQPIRDAIAEGSVSGMSFRFEVIREEWRDANGVRIKPEELAQLLWQPGERGPLQRELIEVRMRELGPVVFPAYPGTEVGVRARSAARDLLADGDQVRRLRASLARSVPDVSVPAPEDLQRDVAAAVLTQDLADEPPTVVARTVSDAPPATGHPSTPDPDAPPAEGHPSPTPQTLALQSEIRDRVADMRAHLASIADKEL